MIYNTTVTCILLDVLNILTLPLSVFTLVIFGSKNFSFNQLVHNSVTNGCITV